MVIRRPIRLSTYMWRKREVGANCGEWDIAAGVCISIIQFETPTLGLDFGVEVE